MPSIMPSWPWLMRIWVARVMQRQLPPTSKSWILHWIAERYLIEAGGYAEKEAELFVNGARKAGLPDCVPADKLKDMPNLIRVKSCDQQRAKMSGDLQARDPYDVSF